MLVPLENPSREISFAKDYARKVAALNDEARWSLEKVVSALNGMKTTLEEYAKETDDPSADFLFREVALKAKKFEQERELFKRLYETIVRKMK